MAYRDERREFIREMRAETRAERELFAMTGILDGAAMDRLCQLYDFDDFEDEAAAILEQALEAEADEEAGDWAAVRAAAGEFVDEAISDYMA